MQQPPGNQPPSYGSQPPGNEPPQYEQPPQYGNQPPYGGQPQYGQQQQYGQYGQSPYGGPPSGLQPQEENDRLIAAGAYVLWIFLGVIILLTDMKNKPFLKFHAYQSITLGLALFVGWIIASVLSIAVIGCFLMPVLIGISFWYAYQAYSKGVFRIPVITDLTYNLFKDTPRI